MSLDRPVFGRKVARPIAIPPHPGPDDDGISRIIPKQVWDGPAGNFLREIGRSPDDPSNMMPNQQLVQARHDAAFEQQTRFIERINSQLPPGTSVGPYAMLPWSLWKTEFAQMLMVTCEFYPTQPWNTMLLPDDERSGFVLDLPVHPGAYPGNLQESAEKYLREYREELNQAHRSAGESMARGEMDMARFGDTIERIKNKVVAMANTFAAITLGQDVYDRHLKLFGETLGWPHAKALLRK